MLNSFSWSQYFTFLAIGLLIYYTTIAVKYFKWELLSLVGIQTEKSGLLNNITVPKFSQQSTSDDDEVDGPDISPVIQAFQDELNAFAEEADISNLSREELLNSIVLIAAKYPVLAQNENIPTRDDIILEGLNNYLSISLSRKELEVLG